MAALPLTNAKRALSRASQLPCAAGAQFNLTQLEAFNSSVEFKLECAEYYISKLKEELDEFPAHSFGQGGGPNIFLVNLYLDGFLASAVSASDVFGHELNLYFGRIQTDQRFYLIDLLNSLKMAGRGTGLVARLLPEVDPANQPKGVVPLLKTYRNCSMHSRLIETETVISGRLTYAAQKTGTAPLLKPVCYLPDDPEGFPCTYQQKIDTLDFCEGALTDLASLLDDAYAIVRADLAAATTLPL